VGSVFSSCDGPSVGYHLSKKIHYRHPGKEKEEGGGDVQQKGRKSGKPIGLRESLLMRMAFAGDGGSLWGGSRNKRFETGQTLH